MNIDELIKIMEARLATLNNNRATAAALGNLEQVVILDAQIEQTTITLDQLRTLKAEQV